MDVMNYTDVNVTDAPATNLQNKTGDTYFFHKSETLAFLWLLFATIVIGNCAVLLALALSKSRRSRMTFFIMNLAIADLSVGLISVLTDIIWKTTVRFDGGPVVCKIVRYLQVVVTFSSTYVLVALSIDRFDAIIHPMNFSGSWTRAKMLVIVAWLLSALFSSPILFLYDQATIEGLPQCWIDLGGPTEWQIYMMVIAMSLFFIPTMIITACYGAIMHTIWTKSKNMSRSINLQKNNKSNASKNKLGFQGSKDGEKYASNRSSSRGIIPKAKIKTVKMTCTIVVVFILCWSPYFLFGLFQVFGHVENTPGNKAMATFIHSLAPLNSAANPIIYCLFSTGICRNLRRVQVFNWIADKLCPCCLSSSSQTSRTSAGNRSCYSTTISDTSRMASYRRPPRPINNDRTVQMEVIDGNIVCKLASVDGSDSKATAKTTV